MGLDTHRLRGRARALTLRVLEVGSVPEGITKGRNLKLPLGTLCLGATNCLYR